MKINILMILAGLLLLTSCGTDARMNETIQAELRDTRPYEVDIDTVAFGSWGLFGTMTVFDYQQGAIINDSIPGVKPYYVINRVNHVTDVRIVTTEPGEITAGIPLKHTLYQGDVNNVLKIDSSANETLTAVGYNSAENLLIIDGFIPDIQRTMEITYNPVMRFKLSLTNEREPLDDFKVAPDGFESWVTVEPEYLYVDPESYEPVYVTLLVPESVKKLPAAWEFWLRLELAEPLNQGEIKTTMIDGEAIIESTQAEKGGVYGTTASSLPYRVIMR